MPPELADLAILGVAIRTAPRTAAVPLVMDSPHSGTLWPEDFRPVAPEAAVRRTQDSLVDVLIEGAPDHGATTVAALFPRIYIDPNRALDDLDPALLDAPWPLPLAPGEKTGLGKGLIWRLAAPDRPVYGAPLRVAEVQGRIERCWRPYHRLLAATLDTLHARFGRVVLVDCHSMKSVTTSMDKEGPGRARVDVVLSDRDGTTCSPELLADAAAFFRDDGLTVAVNDPFKGAEIVRRHGRPAEGREALQIELNRRLYLDEAGIVPGPGFAACRALMDGLARRLAERATTAYRAR